MIYDFDELIPRRCTGSVKWDGDDSDVLPMWVADMDFRTAPAVVDALRRRVEHGIFGYTRVPDAYYDAVVGWFAHRHRWTMRREWIIYTSGVVPALSATIRALTSPGDKVLIQTPVYNCFFSSIRNNGCQAAELPLLHTDGVYKMDFDALERAASDPAAKLLLLCNPHNPVGRVWRREELMRLGDICLRNKVLVVADEIHCEVTYPGHDYTPFGSLFGEFAENSITCLSPSKAFNIAGLQIANIVVPDPEVRRKIDRAVNVHEVCDVNPFGVEATIAAYNQGGEWLEALKSYLFANYNWLKGWFDEHLPQYPVTALEGTYLAWVDCRASGMSSRQLTLLLLDEGKMRVNDGLIYGDAGEGFIRINLACPRSRLEEGIGRIGRVLMHVGNDTDQQSLRF